MIDLFSNTKTSEFYHEVLKLIPYNAFIEKIESTNTKIYCNGKRIKPTKKEIIIAIMYNLCNCPIISTTSDEPIIEWSYRNTFFNKLRKLKEDTKRNCMNYFRVRYNAKKKILRIYFSEISKNSRCKNGYPIPYKSSTMILEIKKYE